MKKQQPQESADEKMLGKVIAAELRQQLREAESDCPETETVAAFYDRTLSDRERAFWEKHFLQCLRCQEYLAEMARLSDADEPPPLLHQAGEDEVPEQAGGWFYRLAWVVPFLIIGVFSAIWYRENLQTYLHWTQETAQNVSEAAPPDNQTPPQGESGDEAVRAKEAKDLATPTHREAAPDKGKAVAGREPQAAVSAPAEGQGSMVGLRGRADMANAPKMQEQAAKSEILDKKSAPAASMTPPAAPAAAGQTVAAEVESARVRNQALALGGISIRGAAQKVETKWRVGRRGTIQKADGSGGWTRIASGVDDDLFDITFAENTGWAVGHSGTVLRSADGGNTWQQVTAPTSEDLIHVSSQGPQQATVIARSGKTFTTADGGQTWK